jgi:hypothetical protein
MFLVLKKPGEILSEKKPYGYENNPKQEAHCGNRSGTMGYRLIFYLSDNPLQ